jgi:dephospho-CoA kinase
MKIWFILGPIGAGKSTLVHKIQQAHNIIYLSADLLKKENGMSYEATRDQMGRIISHHVKNNISFITEGTGQHSDMYDILILIWQPVLKGINLGLGFYQMKLLKKYTIARPQTDIYGKILVAYTLILEIYW